MPSFKPDARSKVLAFFFAHPYREIHLRELARMVRLEPSSVHRALASLLMEGLVTKRKERYASYFKASMSPVFKMSKLAFTLAKFRKARVVQRITGSGTGLSSILLFGSAARGEDDESSDYDILVIARECHLTGSELAAKLGREVNLKRFTLAEWKKGAKANRAFYLEVISSAVPLFGEKPVID